MRSLNLFKINPATQRRSYSCVICQQLKVALPWDWACALKKSTRMHVGKAQGKEGKYFDTLDEDMIRALMQAQESKCALTQAALRIPTIEELQALSADKTGNNITLTAWKNRLEPHLQRFVPVLVRVTAEGAWLPGNVIIICDYLKDFYEAVGSGKELHDCCKLIYETPLIVPQREFLDKLRQDIVEQNMKHKL
jgi:hypothetical protein